MTLAVPHVVRNWQMQEAMAFNFPKLQQAPARDDTLQIVGYGPSILQTYLSIDPQAPILSLSGAHDFLIQRGIVPTWHADCDPRIHKSLFVAHPHPKVDYLMATCCHPQTWQNLLRSRVFLWHADNGPETREWLEKHDPAGWAMRPGPSIGTASCGLARRLGFRRARFFGFDSCFAEDGELRAGHSDAPYTLEGPVTMTVGGVTYMTTVGMKRQAEEFSKFVQGLDYELVGDGLLKALLAKEKETA